MVKKAVIPDMNPGSRLCNRVCKPYGMLDSRFTMRCPGMTRKGFTLIELLVVVLIIGILAAVALPQYERAVVRARLAEKNIFLSNLLKAQQAYYLANDDYATRLEDLPIEVPGYTCSSTHGWDCTGPYGRMLFESHMGRVRLSLYKKDGRSFLGLNYADGSHFCEPGTQYKHREYVCDLWNNLQ